MITRVAAKFRSDPGLQTLVDQTRVPYPTTSVHIGRRVGALPQLVELHNHTVRQLEQVLTTYLRKGEKGLDKRPTMKVGSTLGFGGRKVDAIDYLTDKIKRLEEKVHATRDSITDHKAEKCAPPFAFAISG